ncbi:MAG TPA: hypothetical protein VJ970_02645, partial [Flavobacteriaceae bacterium]|nr:hypothetical protein [Flavobacteriaceae bacterium]
MIEVYSRNNLDVNAYNKCLANSINARIYANSWYLDAVADNWEVLVLNNYEAVMPLPWNEKLFIKYIYPPVWTQQLGVFSNKKLSTETIELFLKSIPKKFKKITIQLNSWNYIKNVHLQIKNNYILPLDKSYDEIIKGYNKNRKRDLQKAHQEEFKIVENTTEEGFL